MKRIFLFLTVLLVSLSLSTCKTSHKAASTVTVAPTGVVQIQDLAADGFRYEVCRFADIRILRYQLPGWDKLTGKQRLLVYYLTQAGLAGRDILWDQNYKYNLEIRDALEAVYKSFAGDKTTDEWKNFETYVHQVWMSNGIHHHYSNLKHQPAFSKTWFQSELTKAGGTLSSEATAAIFDPSVAPRKVEKDAAKGLIENSAVNFYGPGITTAEAQEYYAKQNGANDRNAPSYGINSKLVKSNGELKEEVYKVGGLYSSALEQVVSWLEKAEKVAENDKQGSALRKLVEFYKTGELRTWDDFNIAWVRALDGDIDFIHGFVEVYNDPIGLRGSYESVIEIKDFEASERMGLLMKNAQWFEDNSPILDKHKKKIVKGITFNVVNVAGESGDASPSTPVGVNLPNSQWIRTIHGSKSVSLGNIEGAYNMAAGTGILDEFCNDQEEIDRAKQYGELAGKLHTAMHEVIGHASGQLEDGVQSSSLTLKEFHSTIEEGRADLVALYYIMDPKLTELGLVPSDEVGKAEYDSYIRNALLVQLRRLKQGEDIEEAHMRNRAWVSNWVFEKGKKDKVIEVIKRNGKTYYDIRDYAKLRELFGELLKEVQRITSTGDYEAAKNLADGYGKKVDQTIHKEVLERSANLNIPPYAGFMNPVLEPVMGNDGRILDVKLSYMDRFDDQMLYYSKNYHFLKATN